MLIKRVSILFFSLITFLVMDSYGQYNNGNNDPFGPGNSGFGHSHKKAKKPKGKGIPIDGGIILLAAAGAGYGIKKIHGARTRKNEATS